MATRPTVSPSPYYPLPDKVASFIGDVLPFMQPANVDHPFAQAIQDAAQNQLRSDAWKDVRHMGLASLGVGAGAAGLIGLAKSLRRNLKPRRTAEEVMPMPVPVAVPRKRRAAPHLSVDGEEPKLAADKAAEVTAKFGLPWYGPAMLFTGMGGLALGWKGVDSLLKRRAARERDKELESARQEFHNALLSQYDKPISRSAAAGLGPLPKAAADTALGLELDRLYDGLQKAAALLEKRATLADIGGGALGAYGMYGGLSGLITGAIVYDQMKKRSQAAILAKAIKKRDRRRFAMQPTEIYAQPEAATPAGLKSLGAGLGAEEKLGFFR